MMEMMTLSFIVNFFFTPPVPPFPFLLPLLPSHPSTHIYPSTPPPLVGGAIRGRALRRRNRANSGRARGRQVYQALLPGGQRENGVLWLNQTIAAPAQGASDAMIR